MIDERELWKRLNERREQNIDSMDAVHAHVNLGINQAIGIMNEMPRIRCGSCKWHENFTWVCTNGDSPCCADFTQADSYCAAFERREENHESEDKKE